MLVWLRRIPIAFVLNGPYTVHHYSRFFIGLSQFFLSDPLRKRYADLSVFVSMFGRAMNIFRITM
jgi:hypothetical protein